MVGFKRPEEAMEYLETEWAAKYDPALVETIKKAMPSHLRREEQEVKPKRLAYKGRVDKGKGRVKKVKPAKPATPAKKTKTKAKK